MLVTKNKKWLWNWIQHGVSLHHHHHQTTNSLQSEIFFMGFNGLDDQQTMSEDKGSLPINNRGRFILGLNLPIVGLTISGFNFSLLLLFIVLIFYHLNNVFYYFSKSKLCSPFSRHWKIKKSIQIILYWHIKAIDHFGLPPLTPNSHSLTVGYVCIIISKYCI